LSFFKKLLPVAGAAAGFFLGGPAGSAAVNAALGSGIGTLLAGGDVKDAVKNAALAGIAGAGLTATTAGAAGATETAALKGVGVGEGTLAGYKTVAAPGTAAAKQLAATQTAQQGILSGLGGKALLGATVLGALEEPEQPEMTEEERQMFMTGERRPDYKGRDIVGRYDYDQNQVVYAAEGGYIEGPGTGKSDSIQSGIYQNGQKVQEARLSDGEFVFTERAVRGLGNGDRAKGAAKMYEMMRQYERMA
jgi:hypothetical protein